MPIVRMHMQGKVPMRTCIGCGQSRAKNEFVRVIRTPEGEIRLDTTGRANGRGAYLCSDPECLRKAEKRRGLSRALKTEIPQEIYEILAAELERGGGHG